MTRPRLLDLFCGIGGAAMGYARAGFVVVGVDLAPQPHYPFPFHRADALTFPLDGFDAVHASPPCKRWTPISAVGRYRGYLQLFDPNTDLVGATLERLQALDVPWIVENVPGAPLPDAIRLCGSSFGLRVRRHRLFQSNIPMDPPPCDHRGQGHCVGVYGNGGSWSYRDKDGGRHGTKVAGAAAAKVMGISWTNDQYGISQAIPPAYTDWIGQRIMERIVGGEQLNLFA